MEIRRIGTDIQLYVNLKTRVKEPLNIHSVQAFLVNTSLRDELKQQLKDANDAYDAASSDNSIKYISRFPNEPACDCYCGTRYDICQSGFPTYHVAPYYVKPFYRGCGVYPHTFDAYRNHAWAHRSTENEANKVVQAQEEYDNKSTYIKYQAAVEEGRRSGSIYIYFPAEDQVEPGIYQLILVVKCYSPGYTNSSHIKTITFDYDNVFELVEHEEQHSDEIINVTLVPTDSDQTDDRDIYTTGGVYGNDRITLQLSTGENATPIDISEATAWYRGD